MELWIRSQDKKSLRKIDNIYYYEMGNGYTLYTNGFIDLGTYKTKKRALEVLDEIQNILKPKYILDSKSIKPSGDSWIEDGIILQAYNANAKIEQIDTYVYEMPEE